MPSARTPGPFSHAVMGCCQNAAGKFVVTGTNVKSMLTTFQCQNAPPVPAQVCSIIFLQLPSAVYTLYCSMSKLPRLNVSYAYM